ncbi:unannotated protein [freshwater metagenome]|uniref:Unannotated protein n=1 Tax=freshwater metagenome TaxID=449393 RepID=A0A6J7HT77_9ZZZZ
MFSRKVWAVGAALSSPSVTLLQVYLSVGAVSQPKLEHALDIHLDDLLALDTVFGSKEFLEDSVIKGL